MRIPVARVRGRQHSSLPCVANPPDVAAWHDARASNERGTDVGDDRAIEIGHNHDVELVGARDQLHGTRDALG